MCRYALDKQRRRMKTSDIELGVMLLLCRVLHIGPVRRLFAPPKLTWFERAFLFDSLIV